MTLPPLYPQGYMFRPVAPENFPAGATSQGAAPPPLANIALRKRAEERLCMGAESAAILNFNIPYRILNTVPCTTSQSILPTRPA